MMEVDSELTLCGPRRVDFSYFGRLEGRACGLPWDIESVPVQSGGGPVIERQLRPRANVNKTSQCQPCWRWQPRRSLAEGLLWPYARVVWDLQPLRADQVD